MSCTVLVTGVGGFVGSHVVEVLLNETDWRVIGVESWRHNGTSQQLLEVIESVDDASRLKVTTHDLAVPFTDYQLRELKADGVDYVINVASRCHVGESIHDPDYFVANNLQLMINVLELARKFDVLRLIHVSTDEVYGPHGRRSDTDHRPSSPYAASKAAQEDLAWAWNQTYGLPLTIVNSANMIGERQGDNAFLPIAVRMLLSGASVPVHCVNGIPGQRYYSYVRNVAWHIVEHALAIHEQDVNDELVLRVPLRGQALLDNAQLVQQVATLLDVEPKMHFVDAQYVRPGYDAGYELLGDDWEPRTRFAVGMRDTVTWLRNNYAQDQTSWTEF